VFVTLGSQGVPSVTISDMAPSATSLQSLDLSQGKGDPVAPGDSITVNYCGVGLDSRQVFDSSWARGEPISFALDGLIQGWIDGLPGMRVGGERLLVIPGELAYGPNPPTPAIGPNETLVFVIQLLAIE
jgi:peptidylprolyl isomerase